jgi:CBS domain-containing protein
MAEQIVARDLLKGSFLRLGAGHTLREALGILLDPQTQREAPRTLIVLNPDGSFAGLLTTRALLRALAPEWIFDDAAGANPSGIETRLLATIPARLDVTVGEAMIRDVPAVRPDDRLPQLIGYLTGRRLECLPVIENDRVLGVIHLTDVFNAAGGLALAAQSDTPR